MPERIPKVGDVVIFCDSSSVDHNALVTAVWTPQCVNIVYINGDENSKDQYGRQISRSTSTIRMSDNTAHGFYFRFPDEQKKEYAKPLDI